MMEDYEGVIIWDLPSQIRNRYLKYCFLIPSAAI